MQIKGLIACLIISLVLGLTESQGQFLHINESDGTQTTFSISSISKLSFSSGSIMVSQYDSTINSYLLMNVQYLSFSDSTTVDLKQELPPGDILIYPNPVSDVLKIDISNAARADGTLSILGIDGSLLMTKQLSGTEVISLDIGHLRRGTYICRYLNEVEVISVKIIKL